MEKHKMFGASFVVLLFSVSLAAAAASQSEKDFLKTAIKGDNSEIMLGKIAEQRGTASKSYGRTLVSDHTKAREQAASLAKSLGVTVPDEPMSKAEKEKGKLDQLNGAAFDKEFASYMIKDHEKDISDFKKEADAGQDPVSHLARQTLPVLQKHLELAQNVLSTVEGRTARAGH